MKKKNNVQVIRPNETLAEEARQNFADHVQSIAFNMQLSRRMVGMLQILRDEQYLFGDGLDNKNEESKIRNENARLVITNGRIGINGNYIGLFDALKRRGLCYRPIEIDAGRDTPAFWAKEKYNLPLYKLTRAGELLCELLVEAGLMQPREKQQHKIKKQK